eukprot:15876440-Heterocapsa_arctica.AAC.1
MPPRRDAVIGFGHSHSAPGGVWLASGRRPRLGRLRSPGRQAPGRGRPAGRSPGPPAQSSP